MSQTNEDFGNRLDRPVDAAHDPVLGRDDAEITLVEYGSYACPHCRTANERIADRHRRSPADGSSRPGFRSRPGKRRVGGRRRGCRASVALRTALSQESREAANLGEMIQRRFQALGGVKLKLPHRPPIRKPPKLGT